MRGGELVPVEWQHVAVGDIVKLEDKDFIPADLIVISTSEKNSSAYIETMSMDGETNLKHRQGLTATKDLKDIKDLSNWKGMLIAGPPTGKIKIKQNSKHINQQKIKPQKRFTVLLDLFLTMEMVMMQSD